MNDGSGKKRRLAIQGDKVWEIIDDGDAPVVFGSREKVHWFRLFIGRLRRHLTPPVILAWLLAKAIIILLLFYRE
jgi:hypothetical protein